MIPEKDMREFMTQLPLAPLRPAARTFLDAVIAELGKYDVLDIVYPGLQALLSRRNEIQDELDSQAELPDGKAKSLEKELKNLENQISRMRVNGKNAKICITQKIIEVSREIGYNIEFFRGNFCVFNSERWMILSEELIQKFLQQIAIAVKLDKQIACDADWLKKFYEEFRTLCLEVPPDAKHEKVLLNLQNGTFEFTPIGFTFRDFDKNDYLTSQLNFSYNADATAPMFMGFLDEALPVLSQQMLLAEYLAYCLTSHLKLEKIAILLGTGANGKSVFYDIVRAFFTSDNMSCFSLRELTDEKGNNRRVLEHVRLNYSSELGSTKADTDNFKKLASNEDIMVKKLYEDTITIRSNAKLMFNANELPTVFEFNLAYFRRILLIIFGVTITEDKQDKELAKKIIDNELPGIFNWILEAHARLLRQKGFSRCEVSNNAVKEYEQSSDNVKLFLADCGYAPHPHNKLSLESIYRDYVNYCFDSGHKALSKANLHKRLVSGGGFISNRENSGHFIKAFIAAKTIL